METKRNSFKSSLFSGIVGFFIGMSFLFLWQKYTPIKFSFSRKKVESSFPFSDENWDPFFDEYFNDQISSQNGNPFEQLDRMREQMEEMKRKSHPFDSWYQRRFGGGSPTEVKRREDSNYVYYDISIKGLDQQNLNVEVKDGQISIKGQIQAEESGAIVMQQFQRSFPVPNGVLAKKVEIEHDQDTLILKFPKTSSE